MTPANWVVWSLHLGVWWHDDVASRSTDLRNAGRYTAEKAAEIATRRGWHANHIAPPEIAVQIPVGVDIVDSGTWAVVADLVRAEVQRRKAERFNSRSGFAPAGFHGAV